MQDLELAPDSRSHRLREMYWNGDHNQYIVSKVLAGSGEPTTANAAKYLAMGYPLFGRIQHGSTLVERAEDFAALLNETSPVIQASDMLAGITTVLPAEGSTIALGHYDGHYTPGNANIIRMGYTGIRDRASEKLAAETDPAKRDFLEAAVISYDAACRFAETHALHAEALADEALDPKRRDELKQIASVCHQIATGPPETFLAGLQLMWFTFMYGARGSIGRFDQWMVPLYRNDIESGRMTHEDAQELIENYFVKLNYFAGNNDSLRNIALAGQTPEGKDACNELSTMCLVAAARLMLPEPKLNVRFFEGSPRHLLELSCRLTCKGLSNPAYFNDAVALPGLLRLGIPLEEARDYCNDGCSEL
ncbi:MAG: pyruvate formate lyase family protein, partial [Desulfobacterales bacterium]